jgi:hypothetical protein
MLMTHQQQKVTNFATMSIPATADSWQPLCAFSKSPSSCVRLRVTAQQ